MIKFGLFNSQSACSIFCGASSKRQKSLFSLFGLYKNQSPCSIFCLTRPQTEILLQSVSWSLQRSSCCLLKNEDSVFKFKALALVVGFNLLMTIFRALALGTWCTTFVLTLGTAHFGTGYHWKSLDGSGLSTFLFGSGCSIGGGTGNSSMSDSPSDLQHFFCFRWLLKLLELLKLQYTAKTW